MMTLEKFTREAIMVPFEEFGRSWDGWDCWGVLFLGYREILGIELPEYTGDYSSARRRRELQDLIISNRDDKRAEWERVEKPKAMDGVLLEMLGRSCHIGLMLDETNVLHVEENCMTMVEDINRPPWRGVGYDKVEGFYRHVSQL